MIGPDTLTIRRLQRERDEALNDLTKETSELGLTEGGDSALRRLVRRHPYTMLGGAAVAGFLATILIPRGTLRRSARLGALYGSRWALPQIMTWIQNTVGVDLSDFPPKE